MLMTDSETNTEANARHPISFLSKSVPFSSQTVSASLAAENRANRILLRNMEETHRGKKRAVEEEPKENDYIIL
ncbi:hypothetical protein Selli1_21760 [Sellimonas catena]|uniref:Uncharacterized protein n=1 Tax=Sellimonas catena TaxID=2994035 RepID=A0A9W6FCK2_9FIRM|nr:hypothetical protein Selli1_21760 [Sellimonas catena]